MDLRKAWEAEAEAWIPFARSEDADPVFWQLNLPAFLLDIVPPPGQLTIDVGCGEGRVARALVARGHRVLGLDTAWAMVGAAGIPAVVGDSAALPLPSGTADVVVLFMVLTDVDDLDATLAEAARVLMPGGTLCIAMGHPLQGIGDYRDDEYVITRPYFEPDRLTYWSDRAGRRVAFNFVHRPLSAYTAALAANGFVIERLNEPCQDHAVPPLIHIRARRGHPHERLYVVVSGPPASGKSTLAPQLAQRLGLSLVAKDTIKDALMGVLDVPDVESSRQLGAAAVQAMLAVAAESPLGAVIESNFAHSRTASELAALPGPVIEVFCRCDRDVAAARYAARARSSRPGHFEADRSPDEIWNDVIANPVAGGWPVIEIDTNQPVPIDDVLAQIRALQ
jgi:SAM-dependent methyltransferase/predicted kinase